MRLYDPGLQPERTELAWRRTALALAVGSLVSIRVLPLLFGSSAWMLLGLAGVAVAAIIWSAARVRYRTAYRALTTAASGRRLPDGRLLAVTVVVCTGAGGVALAAVFIGAAAA